MSPSRTERWILANQCEILAILNEPERDRYQKLAIALRRGWASEYSEDLGEVWAEILETDESYFVISTMSMYKQLQLSWNRLVDKQEIDESEVWFDGFSQREWKYRNFAYITIEERGEFRDLLRDPDLWSDQDQKDRYVNMLARMQVVLVEDPDQDPGRLSATQIRRILL